MKPIIDVSKDTPDAKRFAMWLRRHGHIATYLFKHTFVDGEDVRINPEAEKIYKGLLAQYMVAK